MSAIRPFPDFDKPLSGDAECSYTMPARYYTDPDVYEQEKAGDLRADVALHRPRVARTQPGRLPDPADRGRERVRDAGRRRPASGLLQRVPASARTGCSTVRGNRRATHRVPLPRLVLPLRRQPAPRPVRGPDGGLQPRGISPPPGAGRIAVRAGVREPGFAGTAARGACWRHGRRSRHARAPSPGAAADRELRVQCRRRHLEGPTGRWWWTITSSATTAPRPIRRWPISW